MQEFGYGVDGLRAFDFGRNDVEFPETNAGIGGDVKFHAAFVGDDFPGKFFGIDGKGLRKVGEGHKLHMGVADGSARQRAVVFEEYHIIVFAGVQHFLPMVQAEAYQALHMLGRVVGHIALAGIRFDEDELFRAGQYIVFIAQEDDGAIGGDDVRELIGMAEGTVVIRVTDGLRLLPPDLHIKVYDIIWYSHRMFTLFG